jgi:hypothetical protein
MAVGDQYRRISPEDQLIFDSAGAVVGIRSGLSSGAEFRSAVSVAGKAPVTYRDQVAVPVGAPTVTKTGATAPTGQTLYGEADPVFDYLGPGPWTVMADNVYRRPVAAAAYAIVNWTTDEPDFTLRLINFSSNLQLFYDEFDGLGWKYAGTITTTAAGTREFVTVDFVDRRPRKFSLRGYNFGFAGVYVPATGIVIRDADAAVRDLLMITGDSYTQGTGAGGQSLTWAAAFAESLGYDMYADGIGSYGWLTASPNDPVTRYNVKGAGALVRRNAGVETPAVIAKSAYAMGYNDSSGSQPLIAASVAATISVCAVKPFIFGPWTPVGDTANLTTTAATIAAAAAAGGCKFVSAAGVVTSVNKSALTGGDNVHPTQYGHNYIGQQLARRARAQGVV